MKLGSFFKSIHVPKTHIYIIMQCLMLEVKFNNVVWTVKSEDSEDDE
jgi:hypothetical protein